MIECNCWVACDDIHRLKINHFSALNIHKTIAKKAKCKTTFGTREMCKCAPSAIIWLHIEQCCAHFSLNTPFDSQQIVNWFLAKGFLIFYEWKSNCQGNPLESFFKGFVKQFSGDFFCKPLVFDCFSFHIEVLMIK